MTRSDIPQESSRDSIDQSALNHLLGYHMAQADIPSKAAFFKYVGAPLQLRPVEFTLLMLVKSNPGVSQKQLARTLAVSAANITILVDRLTERGWLKRAVSEIDRRVQNVWLTTDGVDLAERAYELSLSCEKEMLKHLTDGERAMILELLDKIARHRRV